MQRGFGIPSFAVLWLLAGVGCTNDFDPSLLEAPNETPDSCTGEGATCAGGSCHGGECCRGCFDGDRCRDGGESSACGAVGGACVACSGVAEICAEGRCVIENAVVAVAGSARHTCAADRELTLWCWGENGSGAAGGAERQVSQPRAISAGEWVAVAAGGRTITHSCAIHARGSLWCWGDNSSGQLGVPDVSGARSPTLLPGDGAWLAVAAGDRVTCGIQADTTLWCWGSNERGRNASESDEPEPRRVGAAAGYTALAAGESHVCAILNQDLYCWGDDSYGQLGLAEPAADALQTRPAQVDGGGWRAVAAGSRHTCGIRSDSSLVCWGDNAALQLGRDDSVGSNGRHLIAGQFQRVAAGEAHTCAIDIQGALFCWGSNEYGQLGLGDQTEAETTTRVGERNDWSEVAAGYRHSCAVTRDGTLWCWGDGSSEQLGLGSASVSTPTALVFAE